MITGSKDEPKEYSWKCGVCGEIVSATEEAELGLAISNHVVTKHSMPPTHEVKRIQDVLPQEVLEGNICSIEDVLDRDILVKDMSWKDSTFKEDTEYLSLVVEVDGEDKILNTGAERIVQAFHYLKLEDLPIYVCFEKVATKAGRRVYRIKY